MADRDGGTFIFLEIKSYGMSVENTAVCFLHTQEKISLRESLKNRFYGLKEAA